MTLTLLHTSPAHVPVFARLRDQIAPGAPMKQIVQENWLGEARQSGLTANLTARLAQVIKAAPGTVICTCTTLGPAAENLGAIRIDRPMMQAAAAIGTPITMAYALTSTLTPSRDLLAEYCDIAQIRPLDLTHLWHLFEAGQTHSFETAIAAAIRAHLLTNPARCVVLAQVSMAGAAAMLGDHPTPVLTSPERAVRAGLSPAAT